MYSTFKKLITYIFAKARHDQLCQRPFEDHDFNNHTGQQCMHHTHSIGIYFTLNFTILLRNCEYRKRELIYITR